MISRKINIIQQVSALYQRYGIKSVTMDDVAKHLAISKKTLYEFFTDKEDLVSHVLSYEMDQLIAKFRERTGRSCNAIEELFEVYKMIQELVGNFNHSKEYDIHKYYPELCSRFRELRQQKLFDAACANLIKGQEEGLYRKDLNPVIIAKLHLFRFETLSRIPR